MREAELSHWLYNSLLGYEQLETVQAASLVGDTTATITEETL